MISGPGVDSPSASPATMSSAESQPKRFDGCVGDERKHRVGAAERDERCDREEPGELGHEATDEQQAGRAGRAR